MRARSGGKHAHSFLCPLDSVVSIRLPLMLMLRNRPDHVPFGLLLRRSLRMCDARLNLTRSTRWAVRKFMFELSKCCVVDLPSGFRRVSLFWKEEDSFASPANSGSVSYRGLASIAPKSDPTLLIHLWLETSRNLRRIRRWRKRRCIRNLALRTSRRR